jgi:ribosomal protein L37AE/L43A
MQSNKTITYQLKGLPVITQGAFELLRRFDVQDAHGYLWLERDGELADVHSHSLKALERHDWIVGSYPKLPSPRSKSTAIMPKVAPKYRLTHRGAGVLRRLEAHLASGKYRREDIHICGRCGEHERRMRSTGKLSAYCEDCESELAGTRYYTQKQMRLERIMRDEENAS